jgi:hypothetical protein
VSWWVRALSCLPENSGCNDSAEDGDEPAAGRDGYLRRLGINRVDEASPYRRARKGFTRQHPSEAAFTLPRFELWRQMSDSSTQSHDTVESNISFSDKRSLDGFFGSQVAMCIDEDFSSKPPELIMGGGNLEERARMKFLRRLSYERVWIPKAHRPPSHQTLFIFDWDDTLLCTSHLYDNYPDDCIDSVPEGTQQVLKDCGNAVTKLLEMAQTLGQTFIITNAIGGWVETSAKAWMPSLIPLLQKVQVVSARSRYEAEYPFEINKWKEEAFMEVKRRLDSEVITNIVSFGDSEYEMEATQAMGRSFERASVKLVKFRPCPSDVELLRQLEAVIHEFEAIVGAVRSRRVKIHKQKPANPCAWREAPEA